jgi:adenylosuccinate lyase
LSYDAISPIDGRYAAEARPLAAFFSEKALSEERLRVELAYLRLLVELGIAPKVEVPTLGFSMARLKSIEERVGHDVKAVEIYIRESLEEKGLASLAPFVHLGLTSEDTNSVAFAKLLSSALAEAIIPAYRKLALQLADLAVRESRTRMLARTHGRPAVPTTFGKEMAVFAVRLAERTAKLGGLKPMAKVSGAAGTYASFRFVSERDWPGIFREFVSGMGVDYAVYTTQVAPGERLSDILHLVVNLNQLVVSLSRDLWLYQMLDYVRFERAPEKVSSSTMPQKVNPVDLENAEGQAEVSNAILNMTAYRLQVTRLQRDLSDSVIRRTVGQGLAHSFVSCNRLQRSLSAMVVDRSRMKRDLSQHSEVYAEALQIALRLRGDARGYEKVKSKVAEGERLRRGSKELARAGSYLGAAPDLAARCKKEVSGILSRAGL